MKLNTQSNLLTINLVLISNNHPPSIINEIKKLSDRINNKSCFFKAQTLNNKSETKLLISPHYEIDDALDTAISYCKSRSKPQYLSKFGRAMSFTNFTAGFKFKHLVLSSENLKDKKIELRNLFLENFLQEFNKYHKSINFILNNKI